MATSDTKIIKQPEELLLTLEEQRHFQSLLDWQLASANTHWVWGEPLSYPNQHLKELNAAKGGGG